MVDSHPPLGSKTRTNKSPTYFRMVPARSIPRRRHFNLATQGVRPPLLRLPSVLPPPSPLQRSVLRVLPLALHPVRLHPRLAVERRVEVSLGVRVPPFSLHLARVMRLRHQEVCHRHHLRGRRPYPHVSYLEWLQRDPRGLRLPLRVHGRGARDHPAPLADSLKARSFLLYSSRFFFLFLFWICCHWSVSFFFFFPLRYYLCFRSCGVHYHLSRRFSELHRTFVLA